MQRVIAEKNTLAEKHNEKTKLRQLLIEKKNRLYASSYPKDYIENYISKIDIELKEIGEDLSDIKNDIENLSNEDSARVTYLINSQLDIEEQRKERFEEKKKAMIQDVKNKEERNKRMKEENIKNMEKRKEEVQNYRNSKRRKYKQKNNSRKKRR